MMNMREEKLEISSEEKEMTMITEEMKDAETGIMKGVLNVMILAAAGGVGRAAQAGVTCMVGSMTGVVERGTAVHHAEMSVRHINV